MKPDECVLYLAEDAEGARMIHRTVAIGCEVIRVGFPVDTEELETLVDALMEPPRLGDCSYTERVLDLRLVSEELGRRRAVTV